ncbi:MAG: hypothetical protein IPP13_12380 [Kouleothrix sp.]|jgi:hypothetical protein|nr:hypothetical protein [Kouleothrix sp.]
MQDRKKKTFNWGSAIGWVIFVLAIAGGPILNVLRRAFGSSLALPANLLPLLIGGLVALSVLVSVVRSVGRSAQRRGSDTRLPTGTQPTVTSAPPAPFESRPPPRPASTPSMPSMPRTGAAGEVRLPSAPRFEPIISPAILAVGLLGLLVLGGLALVLLRVAGP